jgi:hypothetical protein
MSPAELTLAPEASEILTTWLSMFVDRQEVVDIFDSIGRIIAYIKDEAIGANKVVYHKQGLVEYYTIPPNYHLLAIRSKVTLSNEASIYQEALRIALIFFLAEVRHASGYIPPSAELKWRSSDYC